MEYAYTIRVYAPDIAIASTSLSIGEITFTFDGSENDGLIFRDIVLYDTDKPLSTQSLRKAGFIGASLFWQYQLSEYFHEKILPRGATILNLAEEIVRGFGPPWVPDVLSLEAEYLPSAETRFFWSNRKQSLLPKTASR